MSVWRDGHLPPVLEPSPWQMMIGERSALEGLLSAIKPELAVEIGTAEGGSLARIAAHSTEVHSFDIAEPDPAIVAGLENVTLHTGDSRELVPPFLQGLADQGRNVDFVLVDGDHSAAVVRQDVTNLLDSPAVGDSVILMHDTANEDCRSGLEAVDWEAYDKVRWLELDCVAGLLFKAPMEGELWGGLGLALIDGSASGAPAVRRPDRTYPTGELLPRVREAQEAAALREELEHLQRVHRAVVTSPSWRLTGPLRRAKALLRRS